MKVRYPDVRVELVGKNGNAFVILGLVQSALRRRGVEESMIEVFMNEAKSGDYDHLLQTVMQWVDVN